MKARVIEISNPDMIYNEELAGLFRDAYSNHPLAPFAFDEDPSAFADLLLDPLVGVFVGSDHKDKLTTLLIVRLPTNVFFPYPVVEMLYNSGGKKVLKKIIKKGRKFVEEAGFKTVIAHNSTKHSDQVWSTLVPGEGKSLGAWYKFDW